MTSATTDARCTCGQAEHLQTCRVEVERAQLAAAMLRTAIRRMEERAAGRRRWTGAGDALRWYFHQVRSRSSPRSPRLEPGERAPIDPDRVDQRDAAFAAVAAAIGEAERDGRVVAGGAPVRRWLAEHYVRGRAYTWIAEEAGVAQELVLTRMARAHRLIRDRLRDRGWLDE